MSAIEAKLNALMRKMNNQEKRGNLAMKWELQNVLCGNVLIKRDLLMKVPTMLRKLSRSTEIGAINLIPTTTSEPITYRPLKTMRTCLMEVE